MSTLADALRREFPEAQEIDIHVFKAVVHQEVLRAKTFGFVTQIHCASYVVCSWVLGRDFYKTFPAAEYILNSVDLSPAEKADWLVDWTQTMFRELEGV